MQQLDCWFPADVLIFQNSFVMVAIVCGSLETISIMEPFLLIIEPIYLNCFTTLSFWLPTFILKYHFDHVTIKASVLSPAENFNLGEHYVLPQSYICKCAMTGFLVCELITISRFKKFFFFICYQVPNFTWRINN